MNIAIKNFANENISAAQFFKVDSRKYGFANRVKKPSAISIQCRDTAPCAPALVWNVRSKHALLRYIR
jgi:hypothetical protein